MKTKISSVIPLEIIDEQKTKKLKPEDYTPEIWEDQYISKRHLSGLTILDLVDRHNDICNNLAILQKRTYTNLPADNNMSLWYWLLKEHTTRLEAYLKGAELYKPFLNPEIFSRNNICLSCESRNAIFRYGTSEHTLAFIEKGEILFHEASYYSNENNKSRRDNEKAKEYYLNQELVNMTNMRTGKKIEPVSNITMTEETSMASYIFCVSSYCDKQLLNKFGVDACVVINNKEEFERRLSMAISPNKNLISFPVQYYDPWPTKEPYNIVPHISKDFRFALQGEYRFLIYNNNDFDKDINDEETIKIYLGPLEDIAEYYKFD